MRRKSIPPCSICGEPATYEVVGADGAEVSDACLTHMGEVYAHADDASIRAFTPVTVLRLRELVAA
jgi:hypothetical protein